MKFNTEETNKYVVASDTNSLFLNLEPLLKEKHPDLNLQDKELSMPYVKKYQKILEEKLNTYQKILSKNILNSDNHFFDLKSEFIIYKAYWAGKRRYAQLLVEQEGMSINKLDIKGMDLMKSNMPPIYRKFGEEIIRDVLFGKSKEETFNKIHAFKKEMDKKDWIEISKPTSLKQLNEYIASKPSVGEIFSKLEKKCPVNTKAAVYHNDLLRFKKLDTKHSLITIGEKIKWVYLKENPYRIDCIAFLSYDIAPEIKDFINLYIDREQLFNTILKNKLDSFYNDLGWGSLNFNNHINKFFDFN
jgi:hypothetical protein